MFITGIIAVLPVFANLVLVLLLPRAKEARDGFGLEGQIAGFTGELGVKGGAVDDGSILAVAEHSPFPEAHRFIGVSAKGHIHDFSKDFLSAKVIGSAISWCSARADAQG